MSEHIKVAVRVRPFLPNEIPIGCVRATENQVMVGDGRCFAFDTVFSTAASSDDVYVAIGQPLANSFLDGFNVSTIAYGQTGAGKTFTMSALSNDVVQEVFCRLQEESAQAAETLEDSVGFTLRMSALEVYNEHVGDLLHNKAGALKHVAGVSAVSTSGTPPASNGSSPTNGSGGGGAAPRPRKMSTAANVAGGASSGGGIGPALALREDPKGGVYVAGLSEFEVKSEEALLACIELATANRKTATTLMNATSSRSHCVVTLTLCRKGVVSRCCFVDLAGSERFKKSLGVGMDPSVGSALLRQGGGSATSNGAGSTTTSTESPFPADGAGANVVMERMREGISINGGLLALGNVIVALCEKKSHVPFRSSKLTRLLQPMLGGNSRTAMVACISPLESSMEETLNTLKYANRAKSIKTNPHLVAAVSAMHMSPGDAERIILALRKELEDVQQQLAHALSGGGGQAPARSGRPRTLSVGAVHGNSARTASHQRSCSTTATDVHNTLPTGQKRGRTRTASRRAPPRGGAGDPNAPFLGSPISSHSTGATAAAASTAAMLKQISELKLQLAQESNVTKRLEEDLFNAEYTVMIEVEKRRAAEERVLELESMLTPNREGSVSSSPASNGSAADSPRARLTQNMALLRKLEEERDSLHKLKVRRERDRARLRSAIASGGGITSTHGGPSAAPSSSSGDHDSQGTDDALAAVAADIEAKSQQLAALERQNDEIMRQLHEYERELALVGGEKSRLQEELAKAEELLERSAMDRQHKDAERARLQGEYRERLRQAEEKAADYRRRVKQTEQELKMRTLNLQRIELLKHEVEKLREDATRQKASRRAEQRKGVQQSATHGQEVAALQRQLREAEQQVTRLQSSLHRKDAEIARIRTSVAPAAALHSKSRSSTASSVVLKQPPPSLVNLGHGQQSASRSGSITNDASGSSPHGAAGSLSSADIQAQIDDEVKKLERLEKELEDLQECRRVLAQTQSTDAPKYQSALKGFAKRLQQIEQQLDTADREGEKDGTRARPLSRAARAKLVDEREDIKEKLNQLETFQKMFDDATQQLAEFDDRIDSLNEARKYHLHRVRRLQHARLDSMTTAAEHSFSTTGPATVRAGERSPRAPDESHTTAPPSATSTRACLDSTAVPSSAGWDSPTPRPSVREIATARMRRGPAPGGHGHSRQSRPHSHGELLEAVTSTSAAGTPPAGAAPKSGGGSLDGSAATSQQRYIRQLEETEERLNREAESVRARGAP